MSDKAPSVRERLRLADLDRVPVSELAGIGAKGAASLGELGVESVLDLVMYYPRRWADRTNCVDIVDLHEGDQASVRALVQKATLRRIRGKRPMVQVDLEDDEHRVLGVTFFNQPWRARQLEPGMQVVVFGKADRYRNRLQMTNPRLDVVGARDGFRETNRVVPIYPQSEKSGLASYQIARFIERGVAFATERGAFSDPLSGERRSELRLMSRAEAFSSIHFPPDLAAKDRARARLAFDELWRLQVVLVMRKRAAEEASSGIRHTIYTEDQEDALVERFLAKLPFPLTKAQRRSISEIANDLGGPYPMHRLLQGDVGSGKTVVALASLLYGVQGEFQGAFMVPTEVLAEQHYLAATELLAGLEVHDPSRLSGRRPVEVALLTSKTTATDRGRVPDQLLDGSLDLLVGTHALLTEDIQFRSLGVVVIDEQHRFGVDQRATLREKGSMGEPRDPDLLVMTATPIPRTAAMTVYGDLDQSVLDELPVGRSPIATQWVDDDSSAPWDKIRAEVEKGNAAYVVCPLVRPGGGREEGDEEASDEVIGDDRLFTAARAAKKTTGALRAATSEFDRLSDGELSGLRLGLLHGQLTPREKATTMEAFRSGALDVLVATTVIEVGVDVSRATVMVIEDADRFGIAQLHQLRGRVGRGSDPSACYLVSTEPSPAGEERLAALCRSSDGFELAAVDLALRGEGTVLGVRQKGRSDLRLASLSTDGELITRPRSLAEQVVAKDPHLLDHPNFAEELRVFIGEEEAAYLLRS